YAKAAGFRANSAQMIGENVADLGGLTIAYRAFQTAHAAGGHRGRIAGSAAAKRFFVTYAVLWRRRYTDAYGRLLERTDQHAPPALRCNWPLSNFTPFATTFRVSPGMPMCGAAKTRTAIW